MPLAPMLVAINSFHMTFGTAHVYMRDKAAR